MGLLYVQIYTVLLIAIDNNYKVLVSDSFSKDFTKYGIRAFKGNNIQLTKQRDYFPTKETLEWHHNNIYKG